jgi:hypothetical protein
MAIYQISELDPIIAEAFLKFQEPRRIFPWMLINIKKCLGAICEGEQDSASKVSMTLDTQVKLTTTEDIQSQLQTFLLDVISRIKAAIDSEFAIHDDFSLSANPLPDSTIQLILIWKSYKEK